MLLDDMPKSDAIDMAMKCAHDWTYAEDAFCLD